MKTINETARAKCFPFAHTVPFQKVEAASAKPDRHILTTYLFVQNVVN